MASDFAIKCGRLLSGKLSDTATADDLGMTLSAVPRRHIDAPQVCIEYTGLVPATSFTSIVFQTTSLTTTPNVVQSIDLYNFQSRTYESIDVRPVSPEPSSIDVPLGGDCQRFIDPQSGSLRARFTFRTSGPVLLFPWSVFVDQLGWQTH